MKTRMPILSFFAVLIGITLSLSVANAYVQSCDASMNNCVSFGSWDQASNDKIVNMLVINHQDFPIIDNPNHPLFMGEMRLKAGTNRLVIHPNSGAELEAGTITTSTGDADNYFISFAADLTVHASSQVKTLKYCSDGVFGKFSYKADVKYTTLTFTRKGVSESLVAAKNIGQVYDEHPDPFCKKN